VTTGYTVTIDVLVIAVTTALLVLEAANWPTLPFWAPVATAVAVCVEATNGTVRVRVEATPEIETVVVVVTIGMVAAGAEGPRERRV
jgi:hypothetical protein